MNTKSVAKNITAKEYNSHADEYEKMSREAIPWIYFDKPYLKTRFNSVLTSKTKLVEFGCGGGKVIEMLCEQGAKPSNITGVDLSKELVDLAQSHAPQAHFIVGDMCKVKLPLNNFDVALSVRSIEYLNLKQLNKFFKNVYNSLKRSSLLYIITGHPLRVNNGDITQYLNRGKRKVQLPWGMEISLYHKTISDYLRPALSVGFELAFIDEPSMPKLLKKNHPDKYQKYLSYGGATNLHLVLKKK